jgi:acyl-homoserine-lactone acylase
MANVGFGIGYAQAQDGICLLAETFLTVDGERSKFLGPEGTFKNEAEGGVVFTNLNSDVYWTSIKRNGTIQKLLREPYPQGPSLEVRQAANGYAAGYDAYLEHIGGAAGVTNPACQGAAWVRPIKPIDVFRRIYQIDDLAGGSALGPEAEANPVFGPPAAAAAKTASTASIRSSLAKLPLPTVHTTLMGSNGLAVGSEDATNGGGVVLSNPHFPWHGSERFWEMNLEVPGKYHATGVGIWGLPGINIGHNQHVAWTHTVSTNTTVTFWALAALAGHPTEYFYGGKVEKMTRKTITVYALEHGEVLPRTRTLYYSHYGPVIWEEGHAIAVGDANGTNLRGPNQWLAISKAENANQVIEAERSIQGVPWVNTIGADDEGNAFYTEIVMATSLTKAYLASSCDLIPGSLTGPFLGTGSCELPASPGTLVPGTLAGSAEPALVRKDYVENSNNSFWLANANSPLTGFSPALGGEEENPGMRAQTGIDMVAQRMGTYNSGVPTDGLSPTPGFTAETMQDSWAKFRSLPAERALPGLREICTTVEGEGGVINGVDVKAACSALDAYGASATLEDKGAWLFQEWWNHAPTTQAGFWVHPWSAAEPVYTPNTLNTSLAASKEALAAAVKSMEERGIPVDASTGEVQRAPQSGAAPMPGCSDGGNCFAANGSSFPTSTSTQTQVTGGTSIVMFTELLAGHEPLTKGLLAYSQSEDPTSPYYEDQTQRLSKNEWITLPWTPASVAAEAIAPTLHLK